MSSEIPKDNSLRGKDKIIQICEILGADTYYNAVGGKNLYDQEEFREHGITLNFVDSLPQVYSQLHTREFVSGLSMIDVLMNNTKDKVNSLLESYQIKY
ncbi:WbqC family protein [Bacteroides thetaiotaomicron]|nr:WbqC family protein [Bacteroides thetaiotaomicron]